MLKKLRCQINFTRNIIVFGLLLLLGAVLVIPETRLAVAKDKSGSVQVINRIVAGNNQFACELYREIRSVPSEKEKNIFLSPYSISTALAMTYAGSKGGTAEQMAQVLHLIMEQTDLHPANAALNSQISKTGSKAYQLNIANAIWGQKNYHFEAGFLNQIRQNYEGGFQSVDYQKTEAAIQTINQWVEHQTASKIKNILHNTDIDALTRLILTNAIYFKGTWELQFDPKQTETASFLISPGQTVKVPMMRVEGKFKYLQVPGTQILEFPYAGKDLAMLVILPDQDLDSLESGLISAKIQEWRNKLALEKVEVSLPKFKFGTRYYLDQILPKLGMKDAFSEADADFSGITGEKNLYIKHVIHQALIEVNEQGSEAAAATAVVINTKSLSLNPLFQADHPFLFAIIHQPTGSILFMGRVVDPSQH